MFADTREAIADARHAVAFDPNFVTGHPNIPRTG